MDPSKAAYSRYWEPNFLQTMGFTLLAGTVATTVTYPLDFLKTLIQFRSEGVGMPGDKFKVWRLGYNPFAIAREMMARGGGLMQFYGGFQSNLYGRLGYLLIRNGIYKVIYDQVKPVKPYNDLTLLEKAELAAFSGGIAAWITTPFALINIRQITDTHTKPEWRRNYTSVASAFGNLKQQKFKGAWINVLRHVMLNVTLTAPFDFFNEGLYLRFGDYPSIRTISIFLASLVSAAITLPFDNARTRIMNAHLEPERNRFNYKGLMHLFSTAVLFEKSKFGLWAGYYTYFASTFLYAYLTVGITSGITARIKRAKGLPQWQIE